MALGLTIDSQSLDIEGAWKHNRSLRRLRSTIRTRGESRLVPNVAGRSAYTVLADEVIVDLELMVYGTNNAAGTPYADPVEGLTDNLITLEDFVLARVDAGSAATLPATLELPGARTFTANVQILNWGIAQENGANVVIGYDLRIPAGVWTETTPP